MTEFHLIVYLEHGHRHENRFPKCFGFQTIGHLTRVIVLI